jgi:hypothetical protein
MMMGVIDMIVMMTIDAVMRRHIVDIERHDMRRLLFE